MNHKATVWLTACVSLLPAPFLAFSTRRHNLFHSKLTALLDERHRSTLHGRNLHEAKLSSLLQDVRNSSLAPVLHGTPITARRTKFPPWHFMHPYSNETFEGQTVDYNFWKQPPPSSQEIIDEFRKYYPRDKRPRYTGKYNFTEIGSIFEQAFIDGELKSGDYDYIRDLLKKNLTGIQLTRSPFDYLTTRQRKLKPWKRPSVHYEIDQDYYNEIAGINTTYPPWLSTPINKHDDEMIKYWLFQQGY